ncbi:MAG: GIY-YIG nuclease family protein [Chloroflexi bacterium]|nr:GIY-YIG nuclease family protein [Chloroflexota bacterium]
MSESGYIYLIYRPGRYSKIGRTANLTRRLHWWRSAFHEQRRHYIPLLAVKVPDQIKAESTFHAAFASKRATTWDEWPVTPDGEWFKLTPKDVDTFRGIAQDLGEMIFELNNRWELPEEPSWQSQATNGRDG